MTTLDPNKLTEKINEIKADITSNKVVLYMKGTKMAPQCGFSGQVNHILNLCGVDYITKNVLEDEYLRQGIKDFSDWPTIPQLYAHGEFVGGCDIITELYQAGELQKVLEG
jgi:monothiol glutaredoxin